MDIKDFFWDKQSCTVSWSFNGKVIKKSFENLHAATIVEQNKYILIRTGKDYIIDQLYHISYDGKQLFCYDKVNGKISWQHNNQLTEVICQNVENAKLYIDYDIVIAIKAISQAYKRLIGYSLDGKIIFEKDPPEGYRFYYLATSHNLPTVVCIGDPVDDFHFSIDTKTGDLSKLCKAC